MNPMPTNLTFRQALCRGGACPRPALRHWRALATAALVLALATAAHAGPAPEKDAKAPAEKAKAAAPAPAPPPQFVSEPEGFARPHISSSTELNVSIIKVVLCVLFAGVVFHVTHWTFLDVRAVNTKEVLWESVVLGGGVAGLAAAILVPMFYVGLPLGILLFGGGAVAYAMHRNGLVDPPFHVLTAEHFGRIKRRLFRQREDVESEGPVLGTGHDVIFMGLDDIPIRLEGTSKHEREANREIERFFYQAITRGATMIGYLARPQKGEVRFRVAGEIAPGGDIDPPASEFVAASLKRLAGLDPSEVRKPQEGRCRAVVEAKTYELRVKAAGTVKGEQVAIRIIDLAASQMRLDQLGLGETQIVGLQEGLAAKPGLVILSGPKDSGLTTTLHACLRTYDRYSNNIIAFEPHVDVEVENVNHVVVSQEDGPIAASEVQKHTRLEPDVVSFDALSLSEIAQVLAEAAQEHTVLVGLRAADTMQAIVRMSELLGSTAPLAARLQVVLNQRLVRLLCPQCKEAYRPNPEFLRKSNLTSHQVDVLYRPPTKTDEGAAPCPQCHDDRFIGRTAIFELMPIDQTARDMIGSGDNLNELRTYGRKAGMLNLQEEGLRLVLAGRTSIDEVLRAIKAT